MAAAEGLATGRHVGEAGPLGLSGQLLALVPGQRVALSQRRGRARRSATSSRPPGRSTRCASASPAAGSVQWWNEATAQTTVAVPSSRAAARRSCPPPAPGPQRCRHPPAGEPPHLLRRLDPDRLGPPLRRLPQEPPRPRPHVHHPSPGPTAARSATSRAYRPRPTDIASPASRPKRPSNSRCWGCRWFAGCPWSMLIGQALGVTSQGGTTRPRGPGPGSRGRGPGRGRARPV